MMSEDVREFLWVGGVVTAVILAILAAILIPVMTVAYYGERSSCSTWGDATGRDTKFVHLIEVGVPLTWDCFTPDEGGKWIPTNRVRDID